jgi:hypothetical protein
LLLALIAIFVLVFTILSSAGALRFGLCIAALALFGMPVRNRRLRHIVLRERTFFAHGGQAERAPRSYLLFAHGNTHHGASTSRRAGGAQRHTYSSAGGGFGRLYARSTAAGQVPKRIGAIGLGAWRRIALLSHPGVRSGRFFEIDPAVVCARHERQLFRYLPDCAPDARSSSATGALLSPAKPARSISWCFDAFASDSIPTHLITREAFEALSRQAGTGRIHPRAPSRTATSTSEPVAAAFAADAKLAARLFDHRRPPRWSREYPFRYKSYWVALSRDEAKLKALTEEFDASTPNRVGPAGARSRRGPGFRLWTDDYSNIITLLMQ